MSDTFIVNRGIESKIKNQQIQSGNLWITEDGQNLYLDSKDSNKRIHITDVIDLSIETPNIYYPNKIYIDDKVIKRYNNNTKQLETLAELENTIIESEYTFEYDENNPNKATVTDGSTPKKGTIIFDKNGDIGIVTSVDGDKVEILIITNNSKKDVLNNRDIYFDADYTGNEQIGTKDKPFTKWSDLHDRCRDILEKSTSTKYIHILSNYGLDIDKLAYTLSDVHFIGYCSYPFIHLDNSKVTDYKFNNVIFEHLTLQGFANVTCVNLTIKNCKHNEVNWSVACKNVNIHNSNLGVISFSSSHVININDSIVSWLSGDITEKNKTIKLNNCNIDCFEFSGYEYKDINDDEQLIRDTTVEINNTIFNTLKLNKFKTVDLISGKSFNQDVEINADNINLGLFTFNGNNPKLTGIINQTCGLSSSQVYDTNNRSGYTNVEPTLESHLNAISRKLEQLSNGTSTDDESNTDDSNNGDSNNNLPIKSVANTSVNISSTSTALAETGATIIGDIKNLEYKEITDDDGNITKTDEIISGNTARGEYSVAMGTCNLAKGDYSLALGKNAIANDDYNIAINGITSGDSSIAIGVGSNTIDAYGIALGLNSKAHGAWSTVIGSNAEAHNEAIAIGSNAKANSYGIAIGDSAEAGISEIVLKVLSTDVTPKSYYPFKVLTTGIDIDESGNSNEIDVELLKVDNRGTILAGKETEETDNNLALVTKGYFDTNSSTTFTKTVSVNTSWTTDTSNGGYKKTITVSDIVANDNPIVDVVLGNNAATNKLYLEAWRRVDRITTANGSITLYAYSSKPTIAITIQLKVVR